MKYTSRTNKWTWRKASWALESISLNQRSVNTPTIWRSICTGNYPGNSNLETLTSRLYYCDKTYSHFKQERCLKFSLKSFILHCRFNCVIICFYSICICTLQITELWVIPYTQKNWAALISAEGIECLKFDMNFSFCQFDVRPDFNSEMLVLLDFGGRLGAAISF